MRLFRSLVLLFCLLIIVSATALAEPTSPIVVKLEELVASQEQDLSLGPMLVSVHINDNQLLESLVRNSMSENDAPWIAAVKAYTLSCYTNTDEDALLFIQAIPVDKENFIKLIQFENSVTRHPTSKILDRVLLYARNNYNRELQMWAVDKLDRVRLVSDGWVADSISPRY